MIDFHCHLDLYPKPHVVLDECVKRNMYVLSVTTTPSAWNGTSALSQRAARIRTALGLHPQLAHERRAELPLFDRYLSETRYVGEIGLDGSPELRKHWNDQVYVFNHVLESCAASGGRILSIHSRRATTAVLDCLERHSAAGVPVLHWFSGSRRELERATNLGCWFSVGPTMLENAKGKALAVAMPRERVLTETDGPFTTNDGRPMFPWEAERAVLDLATLWRLSIEEARSQMTDNLRKVTSQLPGGAPLR